MITFECTTRHVAIYREGRVATVATKQADVIQIAKEALSGLVRVPDPAGGAPVDWFEQPALLLLASGAAKTAAEMNR